MKLLRIYTITYTVDNKETKNVDVAATNLVEAIQAITYTTDQHLCKKENILQVVTSNNYVVIDNYPTGINDDPVFNNSILNKDEYI